MFFMQLNTYWQSEENLRFFVSFLVKSLAMAGKFLSDKAIVGYCWSSFENQALVSVKMIYNYESNKDELKLIK